MGERSERVIESSECDRGTARQRGRRNGHRGEARAFGFQVWNTLKKPISAPRCLGWRATSRSAASDFSVSMSLFQPHLATKHAIHKNEVAESEAHSQPPPNEPHA